MLGDRARALRAARSPPGVHLDFDVMASVSSKRVPASPPGPEDWLKSSQNAGVPPEGAATWGSPQRAAELRAQLAELRSPSPPLEQLVLQPSGTGLEEGGGWPVSAPAGTTAAGGGWGGDIDAASPRSEPPSGDSPRDQPRAMQLKELRKQLAAVRAQKQAEVLKAELQALRSPPGSPLAASAAGPLGGKLHRASPEAERGLREVNTALLANVRRMEEQLEQEKATRAQLVARDAGEALAALQSVREQLARERLARESAEASVATVQRDVVRLKAELAEAVRLGNRLSEENARMRLSEEAAGLKAEPQTPPPPKRVAFADKEPEMQPIDPALLSDGSSTDPEDEEEDELDGLITIEKESAQGKELRLRTVAKALFDEIDQDDSGVLDEDELLALVDRLETPMSHAEIRQAMHDMDEDSDEVRLCSLAFALVELAVLTLSHVTGLPGCRVPRRGKWLDVPHPMPLSRSRLLCVL